MKRTIGVIAVSVCVMNAAYAVSVTCSGNECAIKGNLHGYVRNVFTSNSTATMRIGLCKTLDGNTCSTPTMVDNYFANSVYTNQRPYYKYEWLGLGYGKLSVPWPSYQTCLAVWATGRALTSTTTYVAFPADPYWRVRASSIIPCYGGGAPIPGHYSCKITTPQINIQFGQIERSDITPNGGGSYKQASLDISCEGESAHSFTARFAMTPTAWSTSQIATSNPALGVSMSDISGTFSTGDTIPIEVQGGGSTTTNLRFDVRRDPAVPASAIATGNFRASAVLIVTED